MLDPCPHLRFVITELVTAMNLIVKRFFVLALPLLIASSIAEDGYSIQVENKSGMELENLSITNLQNEFSFGALSAGENTGIGNADLQFGESSPRELEVVFTPKNGNGIVKNVVELPSLDDGETIKLSINSYLDLIKRHQS